MHHFLVATVDNAVIMYCRQCGTAYQLILYTSGTAEWRKMSFVGVKGGFREEPPGSCLESEKK